jgi:hypothetical protein
MKGSAETKRVRRGHGRDYQPAKIEFHTCTSLNVQAMEYLRAALLMQIVILRAPPFDLRTLLPEAAAISPREGGSAGQRPRTSG